MKITKIDFVLGNGADGVIYYHRKKLRILVFSLFDDTAKSWQGIPNPRQFGQILKHVIPDDYEFHTVDRGLLMPILAVVVNGTD